MLAATKGSAFGTREKRRFTFRGEINLRAGSNKISLLSVAVGLPVSSEFSLYNYQFHFNLVRGCDITKSFFSSEIVLSVQIFN